MVITCDRAALITRKLMEKHATSLLYRLQESERESISTSTPQHGRCAIQMVFISPVKGEHMQPFYMVKSNIEPTVHA